MGPAISIVSLLSMIFLYEDFRLLARPVEQGGSPALDRAPTEDEDNHLATMIKQPDPVRYNSLIVIRSLLEKFISAIEISFF